MKKFFYLKDFSFDELDEIYNIYLIEFEKNMISIK